MFDTNWFSTAVATMIIKLFCATRVKKLFFGEGLLIMTKTYLTPYFFSSGLGVTHARAKTSHPRKTPLSSLCSENKRLHTDPGVPGARRILSGLRWKLSGCYDFFDFAHTEQQVAEIH